VAAFPSALPGVTRLDSLGAFIHAFRFDARSSVPWCVGIRPDIVHAEPKHLIGGKPMADGPTINDCVMELRLSLNRLQAIVEEVALEIDDGKLDSAALMLANQTGKIGGLTESYRGLQERLRDEGADPERAKDNT
jgi:hypothetical protein